MITVRWRQANSNGDYYEVSDPLVPHRITVVHTFYDTFVCLTCRSHVCVHSMAVPESADYRPHPAMT